MLCGFSVCGWPGFSGPPWQRDLCPPQQQAQHAAPPCPAEGQSCPPPRRSMPGSFARAGECFGGSLSLWVLSGDGIWGFWVSPERQEEEEGGPGCFAISPPRPPPPV